MTSEAPKEIECFKLKTCVCWVPKGQLKPRLVDDFEAEQNSGEKPQGINASNMLSAVNRAKQAISAISQTNEAIIEPNNPPRDTLLDELDMENYDCDETGGEATADSTMLASDVVFDDAFALDSEDDSEFDFTVPPTDYCLIVGNVEDENQYELEVYTYDESEQQSYLNHALDVPGIPLCLLQLGPLSGAWQSGEYPAYYIAVGSFLPILQIYDVNKVDALECDHFFDLGPHGETQGVVEIFRVGENSLLVLTQSAKVYELDLAQKSVTAVYETGIKDEIQCVVQVGDLDSRVFLIGTEEGSVIRYAVGETGSEIASFDAAVATLEIVSRGEVLIAGLSDGSVIGISLVNGSRLFAQTLSDDAVLSSARMRSRDWVIFGFESGDCVIVEVSQSAFSVKCRETFKHGRISAISVSPERDSLVALCADELIIWEVSETSGLNFS